MNDPQYYDPNQPQPYDPNQGYYDPNQPQPVGGMPPAGYTRVQAPKKAGDKYKGSGKKGKRPKDPRAPNPWANMGIWAVGLGLPILLIYFAVDKLFMDKISVEMNPYPPVLFEKEEEKQLVTMGQDIAAALREGRKDDLQRHVLWEEVTYRVSRNMELELGQSTVVRDEIKAHWTADIPGLFRQIVGSDGDRVSAQFVKVRQRDGYPCVLIRTMPKPDRVYYFDLLIVPATTMNANGEAIGEKRLRILDIWDCQRAMFASDAVRREVLLELPTAEAHNRPWKAVFGKELTKEQVLALKNMIPSDVLNKPSTLQDLKEMPDFVQNSPQGYDIAIHAYQKLFDGLGHSRTTGSLQNSAEQSANAARIAWPGRIDHGEFTG